MELVFVYAKEHKILKDFDASFSSTYNVIFSDSLLSIEHKKDTTVDYYSGCNLKAIVGKNGAGKSTLLDFIEESCSNYTESRGFIIWYDSGNKSFLIHDINETLKSVRIESHLGYKIVINNKRSLEKTETKIFKINNMATTGFNGFNKKRKNVIDYSLGAQSKYRGKKRSINLQRMLSFFNNSLWLKNKQANYSYSFEFKSPSASIQKWVMSVLDEVNKDLSSKELNRLHSKYEEELFYLDPLFPMDEVFTIDTLFQGLLKRNIYSFIKAMPAMRIVNTKIAKKICLAYTKYYMSSDRIEPSIIIKIAKIAYNESMHEDKSREFELFDFSEILEFHFTKFFVSMGNLSRVVYSASNNHASVSNNKLKSYSHVDIIAILDMFSELPPSIINNIHYGWDGFSTGELAKLNIFSSLYNIAEEHLCSSALVIIDEVDLYLHPEWQRKFVSELISFIKDTNFIFKLQIIITTHSPIIIGDFLPKDIISLRLNKKGNPEKAHSLGFGTGIAEAYVLGMHIKSTYGEHSRLKLMDMINKKIKGNLTKEDKILINQISNSELRKSMLK